MNIEKLRLTREERLALPTTQFEDGEAISVETVIQAQLAKTLWGIADWLLEMASPHPHMIAPTIYIRFLENLTEAGIPRPKEMSL